MRGIVPVVILLSASMVFAATARRRVVAPPRSSWPASLAASKSGTVTVRGSTINSSSRLLIRWSAPAATVDHYAITAAETAGGPPLTFMAAATATSSALDNLESGTEYRISLLACLDSACTSSLSGDAAATARTDEEYWQIRGSDSSFASADHIVSDGNTKPYALRWGADAGADLAGQAQLYYDPIQPGEKGIKIASLPSPISSASDSVASFTPLSGFGIRRQDGMGTAGTGPATFQAVALSVSARKCECSGKQRGATAADASTLSTVAMDGADAIFIPVRRPSASRATSRPGVPASRLC